MNQENNMVSGKTFGYSDTTRDQKNETVINAMLSITKKDGAVETLDLVRMRQAITWATNDYAEFVSVDLILEETLKNIFDGIPSHELEDALVLSTCSFIEKDPAYSNVAAKLLLKKLFNEVTQSSITHPDAAVYYRQSFIESIKKGITYGIIDPRMGQYDLDFLANHMCLDRDSNFEYMGLKTLNERYFTKHNGRRLELPQTFWMRVAMGLALMEDQANERVVEFYNLMSTFAYVPSTPTLLHSGMTRPQLSSCFLTTINDDLKHIFKCLGDNAQLSKWSGGVANDWTNLRATGSNIGSIKTESQGVVPFLKIANDVTAAINRSGSRRGATCVYLETWHLDVEDFLDLRRNTGDERRRTHDINTANWVPDLFMKRMLADGPWTLFSPDEVPDLHHIYGKQFEQRYEHYELMAQRGEINKFKVIEAKQLWRKMLSRLFETGHPWITFKDACNVRSPQDHAGVVHSSNLCTEITLNTSADETAVCNLGSVNLGRHIINGKLDEVMLGNSVKLAIRMLDNVIDINFYPTIEAQNANMRHRPIGLGVMGFQDALYNLDIPFNDPRALEFADNVMELISYHAILASSELAKDRGAYKSFKGSKWDRNLFPVDTLALLEEERGESINVSRTERLDWTPVREHVKAHGMRNSNTMALAPTATISNIAGCYPCIEPIYKNIYVKANMSGEFTVVNSYLVNDLKKIGLWSQDMLDQLKYFDGNVQQIEAIPQNIKDKYKEVFEIDPIWLVQLTAARGKWIDQSQSHNVFINGVSGKLLSDTYIAGWKAGLKTFYYLRSLAATQVEKSTLDAKKFGYTQKREYKAMEGEQAVAAPEKQIITEDAIVDVMPKACSISADPECDVCQ
ncbi:MAG: ribonucleoside-diphosphate reductase subunit alpha [Candidatus Dependentiae bacterium]|nr:ribonucleoside-diphosphate reductase subunit alpha [Candidatus Dependentiae bacterium]